ncbi:9634_t:CDS:10 [Gigaspora rosea]|nr:9634_t:CDS:10 [Gigaspora rosea]
MSKNLEVTDLSNNIPGLYRLLDLCKDDRPNGHVDNIIISTGSLKKLCNDLIPDSFKSISNIDYLKLNHTKLKLIGCYGNHVLIAKLLLKNNIIDEQIYNYLTYLDSSEVDQCHGNKPTLRPGIYLLKVNIDLGLVIHWPELGCYEENAPSHKKKNMVNLHRYLTKLTEHQICLISESDLECFVWKVKKDSDEETKPKNNLNGFVDAYKLVFENYPIDSIKDSNQNYALNLRIALDLKDNEKVSNYENKFQDYVTDLLKELKRFELSCLPFLDLVLENMNNKLSDLKKSQLGEWIIQLSILIPIQIALTRNNAFHPLCNGSLLHDAEFADLEELGIDGISQNISFGWYEGIFKYFGNRPIKVISRIGEQYMLSHLIGTTFDDFAKHYPGVWMSLVITKRCIFVVLDFEELKSFKRSSQEDLFLIMLSTAISNLILFENRFAVDSDMFQRFQASVTLLNDEKLFQAKLCIIIPKQDNNDKIVTEFSQKFRTMLLQEGENNFIAKMYPGGLSIISWPIFNTPEWFKGLKDFKKALNEQNAKYENARTFLQNIKVQMTKLMICDWGPLDERLVQIRVSTLKRLFDIAVSFGIEENQNKIEHLTNRDTGEIISDPVINLTEIFDGIVDGCYLILDSELHLLDESTDFVQLSADLRFYFENKIQSRRNSSNDTIWFENLSKFFKLIVQRRINRVQEWFQQNTSKFSSDNCIVKDGRLILDQLVTRLSLLWTLCGLSCQTCSLKCLKKSHHEDEHDCLTDHNCYASCEFINSHTNRLFPRCIHKARHDGKHTCNSKRHICGKLCEFSIRPNCQMKCAKEIDHEDEHICQSRRHDCGAPCSLKAYTKKGFYKCPNKCIIPYEKEHELHVCENDSACPIQCPIPDCQHRCQNKDHFHALQPQAIHFCGYEHQCQEDCQELGVCRILTELRKQECILPYGHLQSLHETKHGNMTQTEFTSEDTEFEFGGHGTYVLCNLYCSELDRHRHIDYCQDASTCKPNANKQHIDEKPKDYVSHSLFWERTGFKDPYTAQEQELFKKCDHECADEIHHKNGTNIIPNRSFCELPLFHEPLKLSDAPPNGIGYISLGGHHFKCDNPAKREGSFHIIFVINRSESMSRSDKKPLCNTPVYNLLKTYHDNRIGAVYTAVYIFMEARLAAQRSLFQSTNKDTISLILFDHEVIIPFENHVLTDSESMLNQMLPHRARGGTNFNLAIQAAGSLINTYFDPTRVNVVIFLSDSECRTPRDQLEQICKYNSDRGNPLYLITVLFAGENDGLSLKEMAEIAGQHNPTNTIGNVLHCQFTSAMTEINLVNTFTCVAESLRLHNRILH